MTANALARIERAASESAEGWDAQRAELEFLSLDDAIIAILDSQPSPAVVAALRDSDSL